MKPFVLSVCGDPGGARALIPVFDLLEQRQRVNLVHFSYIASSEVLQQYGFNVNCLDAEPYSLQDVGKTMQEFSPQLLLTATSMHELAFEKKFLRQARKMGIPSISVLDFWSNYSMRFCDETGKLKYLPTKIAVMDAFCREQMLKEGFPDEHILITGQPAFEEIEKKRLEKKVSGGKKDITGCNIPSDGLFVLFFSQPIHKYFSGTPDDPGYDEFTVLQFLPDLLENIQTSLGKLVFLGIIPHPTQNVSDFEVFARNKCQVIDPLKASSDLMLSADLILGMTSSRLMEAFILNCPVLSLQPNSPKPFLFPRTSSGTIPVLNEPGTITEQILTMLKRNDDAQTIPIKSQLQHTGAAEKVENLVYQLLNIDCQKEMS